MISSHKRKQMHTGNDPNRRPVMARKPKAKEESPSDNQPKEETTQKGEHKMSFIDANLDAIEEAKPVAEGEYTLVITDVKEKNDDSGNLKGLLVICEIQGMEDAASVLHNISLPLPQDDPEKTKTKLLFMKRFLVLFGILFSGGIDLQRFPGARAKCFLKQEEYQGVISNKIVIPSMR